MVRDKQLPTPPPEGRVSKYTAATRAKQAMESSSPAKRFVSASSSGSNGQSKRTVYGSEVGSSNGVVHDDLLIRLLAQRALMDASENHVLSQDEIDDLHNVPSVRSIVDLGTIAIGSVDRVDESETHPRAKGQTSSAVITSSRECSE
jgi:hypothetical protein